MLLPRGQRRRQWRRLSVDDGILLGRGPGAVPCCAPVRPTVPALAFQCMNNNWS